MGEALRDKCVLAVFAKHWSPGLVKTRLALVIGIHAAARLYHQFVQTTLRRCSSIEAHREVVIAPGESREDFRALADPHWKIVMQSDGSLGERLQSYFDACFALGASRVIVIGADSPNLPTDFIVEGFERLRFFNVVLGPTSDGGYYLVGAAARTPPIFEGILWSTNLVWNQTIASLERHGMTYGRLAPWYDVDNAEDLQRLVADLRAADISADWSKELLSRCERATSAEEKAK